MLEEVTPQAAQASPAPLEGRVLLIEDDTAGREFLERLFTDAGTTVVAVAETSQARAALACEGRFDLIISDIGLPGEDGYGFMRWLRRQPPQLGGVRSIALTACARPEDIEAARQAGFDEHLSKPVNAMHLIQTSRALMGVDDGLADPVLR